MDKQGLRTLVKNYTSTTAKDTAALAAIQKKYPYSQLIHQLVSRSVKDQKIKGAEKFIQHAAIYTADRSLLKEILTSQIIQAVEVREENFQADAVPVTVTYKLIDDEVAKLSPAALRKDLKQNLTKLAKLKKQFEKDFPQAIVVDLPEPRVDKKVIAKVLKTIENESTAESLIKPAVNKKTEDAKSESLEKKASPKKTTRKKRVAKKAVAKTTKKASPKKARKVAKKKSTSTDVKSAVPLEKLIAKKIPVKKTTPKTLLKKVSTKQTPVDENITDEKSEELIAAIKSNKKPIEPGNNKQKEQIKIIDNFIKVQPNLAARKKQALEEQVEETDLAAKSVEFGDSIISETLADILIQQGKKDKAIEVLKRLIWKFPQKKTYFAAQIEELKK